MNLRVPPTQHSSFGEALAREAGFEQPFSSPAPRVAATPAPLREGEIELGLTETGSAQGIDLARLMDGRLLIQGTSGAGKSWTLRRILEQSANVIQQIVIDPEGEFSSLAEAKGYVRLEAHRLDIAALTKAAERVRTHRLSIILDLSDCEREDQLIAVATFVRALIGAPREDWHAAIVAIDEAHLFAPFGGDLTGPASVRKSAIGAVVDLMSRGRKRGLCGILATQRLARLSKSVASEAVNFLVGLNTLDLDIRRAAETIGWDSRRAFDRLPMLSPGDFVAVGPAFSRSPAVLRVGQIQTAHRGAAPHVLAPLRRSVEDATKLLDVDDLVSSTMEDEATRQQPHRPESSKAIRAFIREVGFSIAGPLLGVLQGIYPSGASVDSIHKELGCEPDLVREACALLDRFNVLEFQDGAVRLQKDFVRSR